MARMPDGWVVINENDGKDIWIKETRELVLCKNCKHYNTTCCSDGFGWCEDNVVNTGTWDDFYCADGEWRDSE